MAFVLYTEDIVSLEVKHASEKSKHWRSVSIIERFFPLFDVLLYMIGV